MFSHRSDSNIAGLRSPCSRRERGGKGRSRVPRLEDSGGGGREGGRGAVCVYLPVFWVGFCLCFGETRASFPRNTGVSTCGAARPGAPPTTPLLLLLLQEPHNPVYTRSQRGEPVPLLALPLSLHFGPGPVRLRSWRSSNRETGWTRAASYSEASAAFTAQTELGINSYCIKNYT